MAERSIIARSSSLNAVWTVTSSSRSAMRRLSNRSCIALAPSWYIGWSAIAAPLVDRLARAILAVTVGSGR